MAEASKTAKMDSKDTFEARIVPDTISYQKMIPAFHFKVTFMDEPANPKQQQDVLETKAEVESKENKDKQDVPASKPIPFSEVGGLSMEIQTEDMIAGGDNGFTIRLPKPPKTKNLVLKRALAASPPGIIDWARDALENFNFSTKTVIVSIVDYDDQPVKTWNIIKAYPVKLAVTDLSSSKNEIVIETLELAYQGLTLVQ